MFAMLSLSLTLNGKDDARKLCPGCTLSHMIRRCQAKRCDEGVRLGETVNKYREVWETRIHPGWILVIAVHVTQRGFLRLIGKFSPWVLTSPTWRIL